MLSPRILTTVILIVLSLSLVPAALAAPCGPTWTQVPAPGYNSGEDQLLGVSVLTDTDVWTVGSSDFGGFVQHWDGVSWTTRLGPDATSQYFGIAATGSDVWVVGEHYDNQADNFKTRIKRWDGANWSTVPSPNGGPDTDNRLEAVVALSPVDVWAVGEYSDPSTTLSSQPLILHWNGVAWSVATTPDLSPGGNAFLQSVAASGPNDVWAVGRYTNDLEGGHGATLALRWDGLSWTQEPTEDLSPDGNELWGVTARTTTDAWAAGTYGDASHQPLVEHWNGTDWTATATPTIGNSSVLWSVASLGAEDVWAAGTYYNATSRTLIQHWDGSSWEIFPSPNISGDYEGFRNITATPGGNLWAVGTRKTFTSTLVERLCPIKVRDAGFSVPSTTVQQNSMVAFSFPSYNTAAHTISENSGMGLFSSGAKAAGGSYAAEFDAAATYGIDDAPSGDITKIAVPIEAASAPGTTAKLTWSADAPAPGDVFDVQVRKPGSANYTFWKNGVTTLSGTYTAATVGTYRFRARLRDSSSGNHTDWSPVKAFFIS